MLLKTMTMIVVIGGIMVFYGQSHQQKTQAMSSHDNATKEFAGWIQEKYPEVWKAYLRKVTP